MHNYYEDILSRIAEEPKWWDEHAVPRFCDFQPDKVANIYANEVALVEIACQACRTHFLVAISCDSTMEHVKKMMRGEDTQEIEQTPIANSIRGGGVHYGDPPNSRCCAAGSTMSCDDLRVCEYWVKDKPYKWVRDQSLEIVLDTIY